MPTLGSLAETCAGIDLAPTLSFVALKELSLRGLWKEQGFPFPVGNRPRTPKSHRSVQVCSWCTLLSRRLVKGEFRGAFPPEKGNPCTFQNSLEKIPLVQRFALGLWGSSDRSQIATKKIATILLEAMKCCSSQKNTLHLAKKRSQKDHKIFVSGSCFVIISARMVVFAEGVVSPSCCHFFSGSPLYERKGIPLPTRGSREALQTNISLVWPCIAVSMGSLNKCHLRVV